ncbi:hypothetical protein GBAR_LOCUS15957, partial [Geodia barretti]
EWSVFGVCCQSGVLECVVRVSVGVCCQSKCWSVLSEKVFLECVVRVECFWSVLSEWSVFGVCCQSECWSVLSE